MAKRHKPPSQQLEPHEAADLAVQTELDSELAEHGVLGNAAVQARMSGSVVDAEEAHLAGSGVVAHARSMVEQARAAVQLVARPEAQVARFVAIIENSQLAAERRDELVERLLDDQAVAHEAEATVERHLGGLDVTARSAWSAVLDSVHTALDQTVPARAGGSLAEAATSLVGELAADAAAERGVSTVSGDVAADVGALCRNIALLVHFEEDEEEADPGGDYALEESGV